MPEASNIVELFIVPGRGLTQALVRSGDDPNSISTLSFTQSDSAQLRVRFYRDDPVTNSLAQIDYGAVQIGFGARKTDGLEDALIFQASGFTRVDGGSGDIYYDAPIVFTSVYGDDEIKNRPSLDLICDLKLGGPNTQARFNCSLLRSIWRGYEDTPTNPPPWATPEDMQAAADAALDAADEADEAIGDLLASIHFDGDKLVINGIESGSLEGPKGDDGALAGTAGVVVVSAAGTLTLTDASHNGRVIEVTASTGTITISAPDTIPVGFACEVINAGAGATVVFAATGSKALYQVDGLTGVRSIASLRTGSTKHFIAGDMN